MNPLPAGRRDQRIAFERATIETDDHGEEVPAWAAIGERWAAVSYGRGEERRDAAREGGVQPATFIVLADELTGAVVLTDRIAFGGVWEIRGIVPRGRAEIEISAVRAT